MQPTTIQLIGTVIFGIAVLHTFLVSKFQHIAHGFPEGSILREFFHFLGEVEAVFGMWAYLFIGIYAAMAGISVYDDQHNVVGGALHYMQSLNFTEPAFVFTIMVMAGTRPIIYFAESCINVVSKIIPLPKRMSFYVAT
ncbi:MAG: hypothetical protein OEY33_04385, partial [Bdellovibrionales bacterium]|nr:hypothetical protein [Bdellovibrionales bacterium]